MLCLRHLFTSTAYSNLKWLFCNVFLNVCTLCSELPINKSTIQGICYVQVTNQGYAQNNRTAVCNYKFEVFYFLNVQK